MHPAPRVLIVEDHAILRRALAVTLEAEGLVVESTDRPSADAVLAIADGFGPDVALLDYYLGEQDSLALIPVLVQRGARVVVLAGTANESAMGACFAAGATAVVPKSGEMEALIAAVGAAAAGTSTISPAERERLVSASRQAAEEERTRRAPFEALSPRERQVLLHLVDGRSAEEIARLEYVSLATVRTQIRNVLTKLGVGSQLAAVAAARRCGWAG